MPDLKNWPSVYGAVSRLLTNSDKSRRFIKSSIIKSQEDQLQSWILAALMPWADAPESPPLKSGKPAPPMNATVAREGLKAPNRVIELLTLASRNYGEIRHLKDKQERARDILGMAIRKWGPTWPLQVLHALLYEIYGTPDREESKFNDFQSREE